MFNRDSLLAKVARLEDMAKVLQVDHPQQLLIGLDDSQNGCDLADRCKRARNIGELPVETGAGVSK